MTNMTSTGAQTASVLLRTLPTSQQLVIAKDLLSSLRSDYDEAAASVAVALISGLHDTELWRNLLDVLTARIENGNPESVSSLTQQSPELSRDLRKSASERLDALASHYLASPGLVVAGFAVNIEADMLDNSPEGTSKAPSALQWLLFARRVLAQSNIVHDQEEMLRAALCLIGTLDKSTALAARDLVFLLLSLGSVNAEGAKLLQLITTALISAQDSKLHQTLGYSVWLQAVASTDRGSALCFDISVDTYWQLILAGLRHGDAERRKLALEILKRSVAVAIEQERPWLVTNDANGKLYILRRQPNQWLILPGSISCRCRMWYRR
jgi:hypothetical protein